jgi:hypothetical protein
LDLKNPKNVCKTVKNPKNLGTSKPIMVSMETFSSSMQEKPFQKTGKPGKTWKT